MAVEFSAEDVFRMAEQIEKDAMAFYKDASSVAGDPGCREALEQLASMEMDHVAVFAAMKDGAAAGGRTAVQLDQPGRSSEWWPTSVGAIAAHAGKILAERFSKTHTAEQILQRAIDFEKDTIVFFLSMKDLLTRAADKKRVDEILREELGHVLLLTSRLTTPTRPGETPPQGEQRASSLGSWS